MRLRYTEGYKTYSKASMSFVFRRICATSFDSFYQCRRISLKKGTKSYGLYVGLYYWVTNELLVILLTYFLYFDYFGRDVLSAAYDKFSVYLDKLPIGKISFHELGDHQWSFFDGRILVDPKLVGDFTVASVFMSLCTPIQFPICVATYPWLRRRWVLFSEKVCRGRFFSSS